MRTGVHGPAGAVLVRRAAPGAVVGGYGRRGRVQGDRPMRAGAPPTPALMGAATRGRASEVGPAAGVATAARRARFDAAVSTVLLLIPAVMVTVLWVALGGDRAGLPGRALAGTLAVVALAASCGPIVWCVGGGRGER